MISEQKIRLNIHDILDQGSIRRPMNTLYIELYGGSKEATINRVYAIRKFLSTPHKVTAKRYAHIYKRITLDPRNENEICSWMLSTSSKH